MRQGSKAGSIHDVVLPSKRNICSVRRLHQVVSVLQDIAARHPAAKSYEQDHMTALLQVQHDHQKVKLPS